MRSSTSPVSPPLRGGSSGLEPRSYRRSLVVNVPHSSRTRGRGRFARDYHNNEKDPQNERKIYHSTPAPLKALAYRAYAIQKTPE